jgi:cell division protease FtsH
VAADGPLVNSNIKNVVFWLVIVMAAFLLWQVVKSGQGTPAATEISYSEFLTQVETGNVQKVTISRTQVNGQYRDGRSFRLTAPASQEGMLRTLHDKNVEIWFRDIPEGSWPAWLLNIAPLILLAALWFFMIRQMQQRRSRAQGTSDFPR